LKPRSAKKESSSKSSSSSIFGQAKPREEVLADKGIDVKTVDERIQKKAAVLHLTRDQELEVNELRAELATIEKSRREANEKELPEEAFRVAANKKKAELSEMMKTFAEEDRKKGSQPVRREYERPSERRKRLEQLKDENDDQWGSGDTSREVTY